MACFQTISKLMKKPTRATNIKVIKDENGNEIRIWAYDATHDLGKRWYVMIECVQDGKRVRKKIESGINKFHTIRERKRALMAQFKATKDLILQGADLLGLEKKEEAPEARQTLEEKIDQELENISSELRPASVSLYRASTRHLMEWAGKNGFVFIEQITPERVQEFKKYLKERVKGHKSINSYMGCISAVFSRMLGEKSPNPFHNFKRYKENNSTKRNVPYRSEHLSMIEEFCLSRRDFYPVFMVTQGLFYTGLRTTELRSLRKQDIDLKQGVIFLQGSNAKTHGGGIRFSPIYKEILEEYLNGVPDHFFIFGSETIYPGPEPASQGKIWKKFDKMRSILKLEGYGYTIYSARHKVACDMADAGFSLAQICGFLRHSDVKMTTKYLRSMGRNVSDKFFDNFPTFGG